MPRTIFHEYVLTRKITEKDVFYENVDITNGEIFRILLEADNPKTGWSAVNLYQLLCVLTKINRKTQDKIPLTKETLGFLLGFGRDTLRKTTTFLRNIDMISFEQTRTQGKYCSGDWNFSFEKNHKKIHNFLINILDENHILMKKIHRTPENQSVGENQKNTKIFSKQKQGLTNRQTGFQGFGHSLVYIIYLYYENIKLTRETTERLKTSLSVNKQKVKQKASKQKKYTVPHKTKTKLNFDQNHLKLAQTFYQKQKKNHPTLLKNPKLTDQNAIERGADTLRKLEKLDTYSFDDIKRTVLFAIDDKFWSRNLLSLSSLRKKGKNDLTKFLNIFSQLEQNKETTPNLVEEFGEKVMKSVYTVIKQPLTSSQVLVLSKTLNKLRNKHAQWPQKRIQNLLPTFFNLVVDYVGYIVRTNYPEQYRSPKMFDPTSTLFEKYIKDDYGTI